MLGLVAVTLLSWTSVAKRGQWDPNITRDASLSGLVTVIKEADWSGVFPVGETAGKLEGNIAEHVASDLPTLSREQAFAFAQVVEPWVTADPKAELKEPSTPAAPVDCKQPRFSEVLTGQPRSEPRRIVEVIGVGHDIGLVELRMLELWDAVDVFLIYEVPVNHVAARKPLYLNTSMHYSKRWDRFKSKIIYYAATLDEVQHLIDKVSNGDKWALEIDRLTRPVTILQTLDHPLAKQVREWSAANDDSVLLQNDGDEIFNSDALIHVKMCEFKGGVVPFEAATKTYKLNAYGMETTSDRRYLAQRWHSAGLMPLNVANELAGFVWAPGPVALSLQQTMAWQRPTGRVPHPLNRYHIGSGRPTMGPGAGNHFSSNSDPITTMLKETAVVEGIYNSGRAHNHMVDLKGMRHWLMLFAMVRARRADTATVGGMSRELCGNLKVISDFSAEAQKILEETLPRWLRANPERFYELLPPSQVPMCKFDNCVWYGGSIDATPHPKCPK